MNTIATKVRTALITISAETLIGLIVLISLPKDASNQFAFGLSGQRVLLILILFFAFAATIWLLAVRNSRALISIIAGWTKTLTTNASLLFSVSILCISLLLCLVFLIYWFVADPSRYPLLIRLSTIALPIATASIVSLNVLVSQLSSKKKSVLSRELVKLTLIAIAIIGISAMTVYFQIRWQGTEWLHTNAVEDHEDVMNGVAANPWQFRVLPEYLIEITRVLFDQIGIGDSLVASLVFWRVLQNTLMLSAALIYYQRIGLRKFTAVLAVSVVGLTLTDAINGSNLGFNTYFDVFFYFLAGIVISNGRYWWILPITFFAALNRETSGFIPLMLLAAFLYDREKYKNPTQILKIVVFSTLIYLTVFLGLRILYPVEGMLIPAGHQPGMDLFLFNLEKPATWIQLFITFGTIPFLAIYAFRSLPRTVQAFALLIVPAWLVIHFFMGVIAETRLLLVPYTLVLIPAVFLRATSGRD